jgi:hypothetical protein
MSRTWLYTVFAVGLILFGVGGLFSIGMPFLLTGLVMLLLLPWRHRREVLWPSLASVWGLTLGYVLVAPLGCTNQVAHTGALLRLGRLATTCSGLFLHYSGGHSYNPPLLPALLVGLILAVAAGLAVRALLTRRAGNAIGHGATRGGDVDSHS